MTLGGAKRVFSMCMAEEGGVLVLGSDGVAEGLALGTVRYVPAIRGVYVRLSQQPCLVASRQRWMARRCSPLHSAPASTHSSAHTTRTHAPLTHTTRPQAHHTRQHTLAHHTRTHRTRTPSLGWHHRYNAILALVRSRPLHNTRKPPRSASPHGPHVFACHNAKHHRHAS